MAVVIEAPTQSFSYLKSFQCLVWMEKQKYIIYEIHHPMQHAQHTLNRGQSYILCINFIASFLSLSFSSYLFLLLIIVHSSMYRSIMYTFWNSWFSISMQNTEYHTMCCECCKNWNSLIAVWHVAKVTKSLCHCITKGFMYLLLFDT